MHRDVDLLGMNNNNVVCFFSVMFHHPGGSAVSTHSPVYVIVTGSHHFQK